MLDAHVHTFGCRVIFTLPEPRRRELNLDPTLTSVENINLGAADGKKRWIVLILGAYVVCEDVTNAMFIEDKFPATERCVREGLIKPVRGRKNLPSGSRALRAELPR